MLILRKGKKVIKEYETTFDIAEDVELLTAICGSNVKAAQDFLMRNAFTLAIIGSKARLGNGYIVEAKRA